MADENDDAELSNGDDEDVFGSSGEDEPDVDATTAVPPLQDEKAAIFGSDDDDNESGNEGNGTAAKPKQEGLDDIFGSDDENIAAQVVPSHRTKSTSELSLPVLNHQINERDIAVITQLPKYLRLQTIPFDAATRTHEDDEEERSMFPDAVDMIRWRYKKDNDGNIEVDANGNPVRESNARMIKWSDGSYQLLVGSETFDVTLHSVVNRCHKFVFISVCITCDC
jgi:RNA polymerase-associated protein LEO1